MLVKLTQDLSRGLAPWKEMFFENEAEHIWLIATHSLGIEVNDITNTLGVS